MTRPLVLRPAAEADVAEASGWYQKRNPGRALYFIKSVEVALSSIEGNPALYAEVYRGVRRVQLRGFPYSIFYIAKPDVIEVIGCIQNRRHPSRWRSRV